MPPVDLEIIKIIVAFLSGGLAGAVLNFFISRHRMRVDFVIKITDRYLDEFAEFAACKNILSTSSALQVATNLNRIRKLGDWFEIVAVLHASRYVSKDLLHGVGLVVNLESSTSWLHNGRTKPRAP